MAHSKMRNQDRKLHKRVCFFLWVLCLLGYWSVVPYIQYLGILPSSVSILKVLLLGSVQVALLFGVVCWLSYKLLPKTDLQPFGVKYPLEQIIYPGIISGVLLGLVIYFLDKIVFQSSLLSGVHPPFWAGVLASVYGAVNEEVLLRLFLFTLVYFIFGKLFRFTNHNRLYFLWITNIIVALIFGLGHLPTAFKLASPSSFELFRVMLLNGIPGIVFGWLYWSRSLWAAMAAHFVADLMIHAFLI